MKQLSVFELVHYLKTCLDKDAKLQNVIIAGEISNFVNHNSGHLYFSLKDDKARIACVMFRSNAYKLRFNPKNGDKVLIKASISMFEATGAMQAYVSEMKIDGIGDLYLEYERIKNKLASEGLFDLNHKKDKPLYPMHIAVLVGDKSAALSDIETCIKRRWPIMKYDIYPVLVQGVTSSSDIINTLLKVDEMSYDAIILSRGGGSIEDLWSFNDEQLAYTIYNLKTFIITGIGHEQDFTIADFVSDLRAPTPTAAVELITPNINDVNYRILDLKRRLSNITYNKLDYVKNDLNKLLNHKVFSNPYYLIDDKIQYLDYLNAKLSKTSLIKDKTLNQINDYIQSLDFNLRSIISDNKYKIANINIRLNNNIQNKLNSDKNRLKRNMILLESYGQDKILQKGYSLTIKNGKLISSIKDININDELDIKFKDGKIKVNVKEIING